MATRLYVRGCRSQCGACVVCPLTTSSVLFLAQYCQTPPFHIVFVDEENRKCQGETYCCSYVLKDLTNLDFSFAQWEELPEPVRNVSLPSVYQPALSLVRSGVCVLLRHVIKETHAVEPNPNMVDLLGFRQGSMKMCAEVSGWTKLCEVDLAASVSDLIGRLSCVQEDVEKSRLDPHCHHLPLPLDPHCHHLPLPLDLLKLESHLGKKCRIHNEKHRQRCELARLKRWASRLGLRHSKNISSSCQSELQTSTQAEDSDSSELQTSTQAEDSDSWYFPGPQHNLSTIFNKEKSVHHSDGNMETVHLDHGRLLIQHSTSLHHGVRKWKVDKKLEACSKTGPSPCEKLSHSQTADSGGLDRNESGDSLTVGSDLELHLDAMCLEKEVRCPDSPEAKALLGAIGGLTYHDIEFIHIYSEGAEMTLADLILLTYIYHLVVSLGFTCAPLQAHLPNILRWATHMTSLDPVYRAGARLGWSVEMFRDTLQRSQSESPVVENGRSGQIVFDHDGSPCVDEDEMELSRCDKMKYKALKPRVMETLKKLETSGIGAVTGTHPCGEEVQVDWTSLPPGVHPKEGNVPEKRTQRKCQQLENLVTAVQSVVKPGDIIVDFCSGGGHLGIVLAYLLPGCRVCLVENKEESLLKAVARLADLGLTNVTLYQCNLDYFRGAFQLGVCLHACGSATDMVLQLCLDSRAGFVICPCCYGSIRETHLLTYPRSDTFLGGNLNYQDFLTLGHAADQTEFNIALETQGRSCMNLVDTDRVEFARQHGYLVTLCSLRPLTCSPKNNLLIGTPSQQLA